jgi:N-methylhydantoinase A
MPADALNADLEALEAGLADELRADGFEGRPAFRRYATLQFRRQSTGVEIALPWDRFTDERVAELQGRFVDHYEGLYGRGVAYAEAGLDLAGLRVDAVGPVAKPELLARAAASGDVAGAQKGQRPAWFGGGFVPTPVYDEARLGAGARLAGPAIVESPFTTVVVPPGAELAVDPFGNLVIRP